MPEPASPDDPKPSTIADAASLFADDRPTRPPAVAPSKPPASSPFDTDELRPIQVPEPPPSAPAPAPASVSDGYELEIDLPGDAEPAPPPLPMTGQRPRSRPRAEPAPPSTSPEPRPPVADRVPDRSEPPPPRARVKAKPEPVEGIGGGDTNEFEQEESVVDPIWTRGGEWGPDLARVGMAAGGTLVLVYFLSSFSWLLAFLILVAGGAAAILLTYPIAITMERPVRITPEQAVTDFFAAASHHFPSYRRMWLLLSAAGRQSGPFYTLEAFRDHWKGRIESWKKMGNAGTYTPLKFEVVDFRADKSTGKSTSRADYVVHVRVRGQDEAGPVASFRMAHGLVKGPDRMWYLNEGKLPASAVRTASRNSE